MILAGNIWQTILAGLGWILARLYDFIPNYGVSIIILTVGIRLLLLPLGVKQIRSMQATQALQPKIKAIQTKYKGDRQRMNEEMMKLYKEHGYNPLSGCLPLLLQLPVLITLFAVLRYPTNLTHIPPQSALYQQIKAQQTYFLGANLSCSAIEAGKTVTVTVPTGNGKTETTTKNCGSSPLSRIPYYVLALLMIGTTYFQQRQMTRASPGGATNSQQQQLMKFMPLLFGFWGFIFPAGLVVYWTTSNAIQIGQQWFLLHRKGAPLAAAKDASTASGDKAKDAGKPGTPRSQPPKGAGGSAQAGSASKGAGSSSGLRRPPGGVVPRRGGNGQAGKSGRTAGGPNGGRGGQGQGRQPSGGGGNAGGRKKRPKR